MTKWAVVEGLMLGVGLTFVLGWWRARTPTLATRIAPQVRPIGGWRGSSSADLGVSPPAWFGGIFSARLWDATRLVERWGSPSVELTSKLRRAGSSLTLAQFRAEQVVWGVAGVIGGVAVAGAMAARGSSLAPLVVMIASVGLAGGAAREYVLTRAIRRRETRILSELPTVADMLALAVSAGEGVLGALERVVRTASGVLVEDLRWTLGEVRTGTPLADSFHALAERTGVAALSRFATGVAIAVERGTPLADVLHSQALDVREAGRRRLIEEGGKREIAMMVPVIFFLLPVTVVFAIFPGIVAIRLGT